MLLVTKAFLLRLVHRPLIAAVLGAHRATIALRWPFPPLRLCPPLTIHGRTTKSFSPRTVIRTASRGRIHRSGPATLRRIHCPTLRLCLALPTLHFWAAPRLTLDVRPGGAALRTRRVAPFWCRGSRRLIRLGRWGRRLLSSGRRLTCRPGILGFQWSDAERESTAKPGESVGFGFHLSVLVGLTAAGETLVGMKSCAPQCLTEIPDSLATFLESAEPSEHRIWSQGALFNTRDWV